MNMKGGDGCSAGVLSQLRSLTRLAVNVQGDEGTEAFWCGMANLKMLRELYVREVDISHFGGIMALVGCIRLTSLRVEFKQEIADEPPTFEMEVSYATQYRNAPELHGRAPHGTTPPRPGPPRTLRGAGVMLPYNNDAQPCVCNNHQAHCTVLPTAKCCQRHN
jgi:hypothetical protein